MIKLLMAAITVVILLIGCASLTPEGRKVRLTRNPQATAGCRFVGEFDTNPGFGNPDDAIRNKAASLGANLVLRTTYSRAEAYRCPTEGN